jgi:hypothetical protein
MTHLHLYERELAASGGITRNAKRSKLTIAIPPPPPPHAFFPPTTTMRPRLRIPSFPCNCNSSGVSATDTPYSQPTIVRKLSAHPEYSEYPECPDYPPTLSPPMAAAEVC